MATWETVAKRRPAPRPKKLRHRVDDDLGGDVDAVLLEAGAVVLGVEEGAVGIAAGGELELRDAADLDGAAVGLQQVAAGDAHVGARAENEDRGRIGRGVDIADEDGAGELDAGRVDAGVAFGREETRVGRAEAAEFSVRAGDGDEGEVGESIVRDVAAEEGLVGGIRAADAEDGKIRGRVGTAEHDAGVAFHVGRLGLVVLLRRGGSAWRVEHQRERPGAGELDMHDVVVEIDKGHP